jgi:hypothetical protein
MEEVKRDWRKLHKEEFHDFCSIQGEFRAIKKEQLGIK